MQRMVSLAWIAAVGLVGCAPEEEPTIFDVGCGVEIPVDALVNFERLNGECAVLDPIPYDQLDDDDLGCVLDEVVSDDGRCDVSMACEGQVFEGQYFEITLLFDYTAFPVTGAGDLHVWNDPPDPESPECFSDYDVWIE